MKAGCSALLGCVGAILLACWLCCAGLLSTVALAVGGEATGVSWFPEGGSGAELRGTRSDFFISLAVLRVCCAELALSTGIFAGERGLCFFVWVIRP